MLAPVMKRMQQIIDTRLAEQVKTQKTPAYLQECLLAALKQELNGEDLTAHESARRVSARGGTTDVGRHTGSERRDTSWPLVQQTFRVSPFNRATSTLCIKRGR